MRIEVLLQMAAMQEQVRAAGAQLFNAGALAWELSRICSMLAPALAGGAQLPLATGRSAFINADGTAPVMPLPAQMRAQAGLSGGRGMGGADLLNMRPVPFLQRVVNVGPCMRFAR